MKPLDQWTEAELQQASDEELGRLLAEHLFGWQPYHARHWKSYPGTALTGNGMLEVLEAMKGQGWDVVITYRPALWGCVFLQVIQFSGYNESLPRAVAVAALLAVKERGKSE